MRTVWLVCSVVVILALVSGCGGGGGGAQPEVKLTDASGNQISEVDQDAHPTVLSTLRGFPPNTPVEIMLYLNGQPQYLDSNSQPQPISTTTDANGEISNLVLYYDIGIDPSTGKETKIQGDYTLRITGKGVDQLIPLKVISGKGSRQPKYPVVWTKLSDDRFARGSVPEGEAVYAQGYGFPPNTAVRIYVVRDKREGWQTGDALQDVTGEPEPVTTDSQGYLPYTLVWQSAQRIGDNRDFDIVVDVDGDGKYTDGVDAIDSKVITGFTVQNPSQPPGERVKVTYTPRGEYKTQFTTNDEVSFWVNPSYRPLLPNCPMVKKYICLHKDNWRFGDPLIDVSGRPEWDLVRVACTNQYVHIVWHRPLIPGHYDPIIDVNQNGVFDQYDILGEDFVVEGEKPTRIYVSADQPTIDPGSYTVIRAIVVDQNDNLIYDVDVQFSAQDSGSLVDPQSANTGENGVATTTLKAGKAEGVTITVTATTKVDNTEISDKTSVYVRAFGNINAIVKGKR